MKNIGDLETPTVAPAAYIVHWSIRPGNYLAELHHQLFESLKAFLILSIIHYVNGTIRVEVLLVNLLKLLTERQLPIRAPKVLDLQHQLIENGLQLHQDLRNVLEFPRSV